MTLSVNKLQSLGGVFGPTPKIIDINEEKKKTLNFVNF